MTDKPNKGGRPRIHANDAERRRAWRLRHPERNRVHIREAKLRAAKRRREERESREALERAAQEAARANGGGDPGAGSAA